MKKQLANFFRDIVQCLPRSEGFTEMGDLTIGDKAIFFTVVVDGYELDVSIKDASLRGEPK